MLGKRTAPQIAAQLIGLIVAAVSLFPLFWMAVAGFKKKTEVLGYPFRFWPSRWILDNYQVLFSNWNFARSMLITFTGAVIFTLLGLAINSMAAYAFARLEFPLKRFLWMYVIMTMFIPSMAILIPSYIVVARLGMLNTMAVLILPGVAAAFAVFFFRQFYLNMSNEMEEAAFMDGANRFQIYLYLFLPLSMPPFVIIGIGAFLGYWNSFIWPIMTISNEELFQIMQLLAYFRGERSTETGVIMSGSTLAALPTILLFLFFQRYIIQGIRITGMK